ncbi:MAG: hypothetical protein EBS49_03015 [Verrucomicrobia bacterium]|nr:hypothetical protein [Verrucomicrobiota bacterium]
MWIITYCIYHSIGKYAAFIVNPIHIMTKTCMYVWMISVYFTIKSHMQNIVFTHSIYYLI